MAETGLVLSKEDAFNNVMAKIAALEKIMVLSYLRIIQQKMQLIQPG